MKDFSEGERELFASIHESTALEFFYLKNAVVCGSFKKDNESSEKKTPFKSNLISKNNSSTKFNKIHCKKDISVEIIIF